MSVRAFAHGDIAAGFAWYVGAGVLRWAAAARQPPSERPGIYHVLGRVGAPLAWALWPLVVVAPLLQRAIPATESESTDEFIERFRRESPPPDEDDDEDDDATEPDAAASRR